MVNTSTLNKLIQLSYSELPESQHEDLASQVSDSYELSETFAVIEELKTLLDGEMEAPNPTSVKIILEESQRSSALEMH